MWVFLNDAFLSVVADQHSDRLLVRARIAGDIERTFPDSAVTEGGGTDYRFRAWIDRDTVAATLYQAAMNIGYGNFKGSVRDVSRHDAYMDVWHQMMAYQRREQPLRRVREPGGDDEFDAGFWNPVPKTKPAKKLKARAAAR
jgi:hypothetical protein